MKIPDLEIHTFFFQLGLFFVWEHGFLLVLCLLTVCSMLRTYRTQLKPQAKKSVLGVFHGWCLLSQSQGPSESFWIFYFQKRWFISFVNLYTYLYSFGSVWKVRSLHRVLWLPPFFDPPKNNIHWWKYFWHFLLISNTFQGFPDLGEQNCLL